MAGYAKVQTPHIPKDTLHIVLSNYWNRLLAQSATLW